MTASRCPYAITRRQALRYAAAGVIGIPSVHWFANLAAAAAAPAGKSCLLLWLGGGSPHTDTFDMKPDAGEEYRGEFKPIASSLKGAQVCELLPETAKIMHHAALIRSMNTVEVDHDRARLHLHTGKRPMAGGPPFPSIGSIVMKETNGSTGDFPDYLLFTILANRAPHRAGYLGSQYEPLVIQNPDKGLEFAKAAVDEKQHATRMNLLRDLEADFAQSHPSEVSVARATTTANAAKVMTSAKLKAFDLTKEPAALREAYGNHFLGKSCLTARRLLEGGARFVEVLMGGWDTHKDNFNILKKTQCPQLDSALPSLIRDLKDRGRLDDTLVVVMGEFGRTPKIDDGAGRGHYAKAWSALMFGGGIRAGQVIGRTDKVGATVEDRPIGADEYMATIYQLLGVDYTKTYKPTSVNRPLAILDNPERKVIKEILP